MYRRKGNIPSIQAALTRLPSKSFPTEIIKNYTSVSRYHNQDFLQYKTHTAFTQLNKYAVET